MGSRLPFQILPQPNNSTCGPTCLHAVYQYYGETIGLDQVVREVPMLREGGTLAVFLACHALRRGYGATIYTYNLQVFDPTWFAAPDVNLPAKLRAQLEHKRDPKLSMATLGYLEYLEAGGRIRLEDLTPRLIRKYLTRGRPILTGLSATYLYRTAREYGPYDEDDDVRGQPMGHFVVLCGYDRQTRQVLVADPLHPNPLADTHIYSVGIERALGAILLGAMTYDANLLMLEPPPRPGACKGR